MITKIIMIMTTLIIMTVVHNVISESVTTDIVGSFKC